MNLNDVLSVVNTEGAGALCLSKGGWEGWLQCELWRYLNVFRGVAAEREVSYPGSKDRCDLVVYSDQTPFWVEIKAFGIFREGDVDRFLDSIGIDLMKLENKPQGVNGLALVVVPKAIGSAFSEALISRKWLGFERTDSNYAFIYYMTF